MKVFVAGGTGAIGRSLVPLLVGKGDEVVALTRTPRKAKQLEALGARATVGNALDQEGLTAAITKAEPEVIIHQLTALADISGNFRKMDQEFSETNRLRTETMDTIVRAARMVGARRLIAQSFCGWPFARQGGAVKTEEDPLDPDPPAAFHHTLAAIRYLEETVQSATDIEAIALRYGMLYGPGTGIAVNGMIVNLVRTRRLPVVGNGAGTWSFVHVDDVARATAAAMDRAPPGIYNVVDDEPAPVATWLPFLSDILGAKPPRRVPVWLARLLIGEGGVSMMTQVRGGSNAKAQRELGWELIFPTWRLGFVEGLE